MKRIFYIAISSIFLLPTISVAQENYIKITLMDKKIKNLPETINTFAQQSNISSSDADKILLNMNKAAIYSKRFENADPHNFLFAYIYSYNPFHLTIKTKSYNQFLENKIRNTVDKNDILDTSYKISKYSDEDEKKISQDIIKSFSAYNIVVQVSFDYDKEQFTIYTENIEAAKAIIGEKKVIIPDNTIIKKDKGIMTTATTVYWPGGANFNTNTMGCTSGFNVVQEARVLGAYWKGFVSAWHCWENGSGRGYLDAYENPVSNPSAISAKIAYATPRIKAQDVDFYNLDDIKKNKLQDCIFDGSRCIRVMGSENTIGGIWVCKYGRTTKKTCGYIENTIYNDSYGSFYRVNVNDTYKKMSVEGDSGGPVYDGNTVLGIVHGRDSAYNLYYSAIRTWQATSAGRNWLIVGAAYNDGWTTPPNP